MIFINHMDERVSICKGDIVLVDGVEYSVAYVYEDGTFEASDYSGEMHWFEVDDIG